MDPAQVEHMDSFAVLSFDSEDAAATHMALMTGPDSGCMTWMRLSVTHQSPWNPIKAVWEA